MNVTPEYNDECITETSHHTMDYTKDHVENICKMVLDLSADILKNVGLYHKEGIYQDLLIHELNSLHYKTIREKVFNYTFKDSVGSLIYIGNNQCLRSDIELPDDHGILELKASTSDASNDNIWQLRNYLEQRTDLQWGSIVNFISKCTPKCQPRVQCIILYKSTHPLTSQNTYSKQVLYSEEYSPEQFAFEEW